MNYNKRPLSTADQVALLKSRGLIISDDKVVESYLSNISYYRLRAYTYPFQDNSLPEHPFKSSLKFERIIELYVFDRKLRLLIIDALEKIEIAIRTQIIYTWALNYGSHWQINPMLYRNPGVFSKHMTTLQKEILRSSETFIDHYRNTYTFPVEPPAWMSLEVSSFGLLSLLFKNLKNGIEKKAVASYFGLNDVSLLENWMHCFSNIRNICAHHSRLWNRRLTAHIKLPTYPLKIFLKDIHIYPYKLYAAISCMQYVLNIINPQSTFKVKLKDLIDSCPLKQEKEMGFIDNWYDEPLWG